MYATTEWLLSGVDRVWAPMATPLGLILAFLVSGHILLHKRDVAASIGWIGLAWMAPLSGTALYLLFGVNRVVRRARHLRRRSPPRHRAARLPASDFSHSLQPIQRAVHRITGRQPEGQNAIQVFRNGDEGYPAMLAAIEAARSSVALSTYIMRNDEVGQCFLAALVAASRRGVEVRVLLDGVGSGYFSPMYGELRRNGIPAALFMHSALPWRMPFLNLRNHKKLLIIDGQKGFTGGMNLSLANLLARNPKFPVADTHFLFEGPVVAQLMDSFARDWDFAADEDLVSPIWYPELHGSGQTIARVVSSGPDQDLEKIKLVLLEAIGCATASIQIMTPYFLPTDEVVTALALAAMRGVEVDLLVPRKSDHRFVDCAMRAHIGPLIEHGVRVWSGVPPFNHSKLMVVDHQWCLIGSANWDTRSLRLNFELDVEVYSGDLAQELDAIMRSQRHLRLREQELEARSLPVKLRDAALRLLLPYI